MAEYGLQFVEGLVVEGSISYTYARYLSMYPKIGANEITDKAGSNVYIVLPNSHGIRLAEDIPATVKVTKLMTTTDSAFAKMELPEVGEIVRTDADEPGPFSLASWRQWKIKMPTAADLSVPRRLTRSPI